MKTKSFSRTSKKERSTGIVKSHKKVSYILTDFISKKRKTEKEYNPRK